MNTISRIGVSYCQYIVDKQHGGPARDHYVCVL
jgi:hypothetical protein